MMKEAPRSLLNKYFVCLAGQDGAVAFNPFLYNESDFPGFIEINYLAGALQELENQETISGKTVYITWDTTKLPSYGEQVVVILMGDEWCRFPNYLGQVSTLFRSHSNWPMFTGTLKRGVTYQNFIALVQFFRLHMIGLTGRWRYLLRRLKPRHIPTRTFTIPLGYANQAELEVKPMGERNIAVSFAGSMQNFPAEKTSLKYWFSSPKHASRSAMVLHAQKLQERHPSLSVYLQGSDQFAGNLLGTANKLKVEKSRYSSLLMDTKIALVPRGSSLETFRLFEAMRYGCVAICENLPRRWYYQGLPALELDNWEHLEDLVLDLVHNSEQLEHLHQKALEYWQNVCSEKALGLYLAEKLKSTEELTAKTGSPPPYIKQHLRPGG